MEGPATRTRTSEQLFFLRPDSGGHEIATQTQAGNLVIGKESWPARLQGLGNSARAQLQSALLAIPTAFNCEIDRGTLFLFLPVFSGIGAIFYFNAAVEPRLGAVLSGLTLLIGCHALAHARPMIRLVLLLATALVAGMLFGKVETMRAGTRMLGSEVTTRMTGRVTAMSRDAKGGWRLTMDVISTARPALQYGPDRITVSARSVPRDLRVGDGLAGLVHLRPQSGPVRPGNYDFAFYNYYRGVGASGFLLGKLETVPVALDTGPVATTLMAIANIRQQLTQRILRNIRGEPGDIAASLITGQRDGISDDTNNAFRLSGLSHILSISGFHMALVAATIIGSLRAIMAFFPGFSARFPVKKFSAVIALMGSAFYLLLSGSDVAAQRSFVTLAVMLLAMTVDRAAISMRNLAIAALITIAISPHEILGPSFQMSYSATAALIAFYSWWSHRQGRRAFRRGVSNHLLLALPLKAINHIGAIAMTSVVAGTASSIFAAYHFNNTAPFGLVGNALALPVISVFVMPFAVLGLLAMPFDLDWLPFTVMGQGIEIVIAIAKMVASRSPSGNLGLMPQGTLVLMSVGLILLLFLSTRLRLCSIPVLATAALFMLRAQEPGIIVSEDGKLVALRTGDRDLAINRTAGSAFSLNNWQQGYGINEVVKPLKAGALSKETQFECVEKLCTAREPGGLIIAYTDDRKQTVLACGEGDIVILAFAGAPTICGDKNTLVLTKRDLALHGTAEITLKPPEPLPPTIARNKSPEVVLAEANDSRLRRLRSASINYAVGPPDRPWNTYRTYSRAARNIEDYKSRKRVNADSDEAAACEKSADC
ncbi:ComEC/Rec2 family competence protein [Phyllobacterium sp. LjRoot231]|uniref:ComEC/Rec2 family competence protein n=1 Tax=Phyllobacterium sp. LjRoot231 TaxID=3342289 RepID=UPI003ECDEF53